MSLFRIDLLHKWSEEAAYEVVHVSKFDFIYSDFCQLRSNVRLIQGQFPCGFPSYLCDACHYVDAVIGSEVLFKNGIVNRVEDDLVINLVSHVKC